MPNIQTQTAIDTLSELYGKPSWLKTPKQGQNLEKVFAEWDAELKKYSEEQLKVVCRKMYKYRRTSTFPSLAHILAELVDVAPANPPELPQTQEPTVGYFTDFSDFRDDCVRNGYKGKICFSYDVNEALHLLCDDVEGEFPADNRFKRRSTSDLVRIAVLNGVFWPKLEAFLTRIVANNPDMVQITGGATSYAIPAQFDVNNTKRSCA